MKNILKVFILLMIIMMISCGKSDQKRVDNFLDDTKGEIKVRTGETYISSRAVYRTDDPRTLKEMLHWDANGVATVTVYNKYGQATADYLISNEGNRLLMGEYRRNDGGFLVEKTEFDPNALNPRDRILKVIEYDDYERAKSATNFIYVIKKGKFVLVGKNHETFIYNKK